ncbi:MAG TPA: hypothetical protein PKW33_20520 [Anaerolineaceae bacterium]|nr:hypothetical protein [Anaerolineaceae bacterium]HPN53992.1 hypothetical protein [Anaerolineaceae bacterium]
MRKSIPFFLLAFFASGLVAAAPAAPGSEVPMWDVLFNTTLLAQAHPNFAAAGVMNIIAGVMALVLLLVFFRDILRTGWAVLGAIMLPLLFNIILPVLVDVLPPPLGSIIMWLVIIAFIGLLLWALVDWWQNRGKKEVRVTGYSRQVRIEPRCIFCRKMGASVLTLEEKEETQDGSTRSYYKATLPYPAHYECDERSKTRDRITFWTLVGAVSLMGLLAIVQAVIVLTTPIEAVALNTPMSDTLASMTTGEGATLVTTFFGINLVFMLLTLTINSLSFGFEKTRDKIYKYVNKHTI